jgi:hypothetical protein
MDTAVGYDIFAIQPFGIIDIRRLHLDKSASKMMARSREILLELLLPLMGVFSQNSGHSAMPG